jgi:ligand-binding sensor domain-containing protein
MNFFCTIFLLLLLYTTNSHGQQPFMRHYTVRDGLPSNTIYYAFQDSRGFMWFCTELGVSRFDGHHFETFNSNNGLLDNEVFLMYEDSYHRCWLVCYNREPCYILDGKIYSAANDGLCRQIKNAGINYATCFVNKNGDYCLAGNKTCILGENNISMYPAADFNNNVQGYFINNGTEYLVTTKGLRKIGEREVIGPLPRVAMWYFSDNHLYVIERFPINYLVYFYDIELGEKALKVIKKIPVHRYIYDIAKRDDGNIWLCTEKGIIPYIRSSGILDTAKTVFPEISVNHIQKDSEGNFWFPTVNEGVYMQPSSGPLVYNTGTGLSDNNVLSVAVAENGALITGYDNGTINIQEGKQTGTISPKSIWRRNRVRYLSVAERNELFASSDKGLLKINIINGRTRIISTKIQKSTTFKRDHGLFGESEGVQYYDLKKDITKRIWNKTAIAVAEDNRQVIWLGTLEGLYCKEGEEINKWNRDSIISHSRITALASLPDGRLVIGTHQNGIFILQNNDLLHLSTSTGLSSDICRRIFADSINNIWLSTDEGLDKISLTDHKYKVYHFSNADGLISNTINDVAFKGSKAYIATSEGVVLLDRDRTANPVPPKIYILSVQIKDSTFNYPTHVTLSHKQNSLRINYSGISFISGNDISYKYVVQGGGNADTLYTTLTELNLNTIKPGSYKVLVWAVDKNKKASISPAVFAFTITPPFWQRLWFISCIVILCAVAVVVIYRRRVSGIRLFEKEKTERGKRIAALEMQALRAQINPHFMFNALNAIQNYYNNNDERSANYYMSSFARLIRQTLTNAKVHWIDLAEETAMLKAYIELEQMRLNNSFEYEIKIDSNSLQVKIPAMLLQPYVENAVNHGLRHLTNEKGKLIVSCRTQESGIVCIIDDNGIGIEEARKFSRRPAGYTSMGMTITRQRIETINKLYNTDIVITVTDKRLLNENLHGTLIEINIPLNTEL